MQRHRTLILAAGAVAMLSGARVALAADAATICQATKLDLAAKYAQCRLKAMSNALKKDETVDYTKCNLDKFSAVEGKAGRGVCPTEGDQGNVTDYLMVWTSGLANALGRGGTLPTDLQVCSEDLATCSDGLAKCEASLSATSTDLADCTGNFDTCAANLSTTNADLGACSATLSTCQSDLSTANTDLGDCQSGLAGATAGLGACSSSLTGCQSSLSTTNADLSNCQYDLATANDSLTTCYAGTCGNGWIEEGEDCDVNWTTGTVFTTNETCISKGLPDGTLGCAAGCVYDTSGCGRFVDNGDGTITDTRTHLMWEKKSDNGDIHDKDNNYTWSTGTNDPDGTAFTVFVPALNTAVFAGHSDWRLPTLEELKTVVDRWHWADAPKTWPIFKKGLVPGCDAVSLSCSWTRTLSNFYWSSSPNPWASNLGNGVIFDYGGSANVPKTYGGAVRAVRSIL